MRWSYCQGLEVLDMSSRSSANKWTLFALCAIAYFFANFHRVSSAVIASDLQQEFNASSSVLGVLSSTYFWVYALLQLPLGMAADRYSPRLLIAMGMAIATLGALAFGLSRSLGVAVVARTLAGAGVAAVYIPSLKLLGEAFGGANLPTVIGLLIAAGNVGSLSASSPFAVLVAAVGWRWSFMVIAAVSAIIASAAWAFLRGPWDNPRRQRRDADGGTNKPQGRIQTRELMVFFALGLGMFLKHGPLMGYQGLWGVPYFMDVYQMTKVQAGSLLMWISIGYIVGGPVIGRVSDRQGLSLRSLLIGTSALYWLSWIPLAFMTEGASRMLLCATSLLMGTTGSASGVVAHSLSSRHSGAGRSGTGLGIVNGLTLLGGAVFQPLMGFTIDRSLAAGLTVTVAYARTFQMVFAATLGMVLISLLVHDPAAQSGVKRSGTSFVTEEANKIGI